MSDYVSTLESELLRAAGERLPARRRRRRIRTLRAGLAVAASAAVVVAVLVIAVGGHRPAASTRAPASPAPSVVARLAILRRPQTAADRALNRLVARNRIVGPHRNDPARILPGDTRLVGYAPGGPSGRLAVFVVMEDFSRSLPRVPGAPPVHGPQASVEVIPTGETGGWMFGTNAAIGQPSAITSFYGYAVALIPDGVARVRWTFRPDPLKPGRHVTPPTRTVSVHENVAIVRIPPVARAYVPLELVRATWYAADGRVIEHYR